MLNFTHKLQCQFKTFVNFHIGLNSFFAFLYRTGSAFNWQSIPRNKPTVPLKKYRVTTQICPNTAWLFREN